VVGGLCRQSQLLQAAGAVAVGDADPEWQFAEAVKASA
jgi:hypothetical protein